MIVTYTIELVDPSRNVPSENRKAAPMLSGSANATRSNSLMPVVSTLPAVKVKRSVILNLPIS